MTTRNVFTVLFAITAATGQTVAAAPPGVEQIIPRGRLAAIDDPEFLPADVANMPDDAWVLAVEIDGDARAYDLNLLNHHEVVNDVVGGRPIAAVW
jgi:hypothetical protein